MTTSPEQPRERVGVTDGFLGVLQAAESAARKNKLPFVDIGHVLYALSVAADSKPFFDKIGVTPDPISIIGDKEYSPDKKAPLSSAMQRLYDETRDRVTKPATAFDLLETIIEKGKGRGYFNSVIDAIVIPETEMKRVADAVKIAEEGNAVQTREEVDKAQKLRQFEMETFGTSYEELARRDRERLEKTVYAKLVLADLQVGNHPE